jgi:hypothetical protein
VGLSVTLRGMAALCVAVVLAAFASAAQARGPDVAEVEKAANVASGGLIMYAPTSFASTHGGRLNVDFVPGVFAQSAQHIHILSYDRIAKSFRQDLTFETASIPGVALVSGPLGRKQLQIQTESGVVVCDLGGFFDGGKVVTQVYERLIAAGVHTFESPGWVNPVVVPGPVVITVYVPAHR